MEELVPIFSLKSADGTLTKISPTVEVDGKSYKPASFVEGIAEEIAPQVKSIVEGEVLEQVTIAGYILLESLIRAGQVGMVEMIFSNPQLLYQASIFCSIGMTAGGIVPEGVKIGTKNSEGSLGLRSFVTGGSSGSENPSS